MLISESDEICVRIKRASESIERVLNSQLSDDGITLTQYKIMYTLFHRTDDGTATQKEIEDYLSVTHPTAVGLFRRMESKGLIINLGREGKSSKTIKLTPMGRALIKKNEHTLLNTERKLKDIIGEANIVSFMESLNTIENEFRKAQ